MSEETPQEVEVLPARDESSGKDKLGIEEVNFLALVSNFTERPDLLIAEVEKHDPGFIKRMNGSAQSHSERFREVGFKFGRRQAYMSLTVQVIAAVSRIPCRFLPCG